VEHKIPLFIKISFVSEVYNNHDLNITYITVFVSTNASRPYGWPLIT